MRLPEGASRAPPRREKPPRARRLCPRCGSPRVASDLNFISTPRYVCEDCGFRGAFLVTEADPAAVGPDEEGRP